jgi:hypothetical protein
VTKSYVGFIDGHGEHRVGIEEPGDLVMELDPRIGFGDGKVNHSPDGFCWGYGGSGPAQLAFAILSDTLDWRIAQRHYMEFKSDVIAKLEMDKPFTLPEKDVREWLVLRLLKEK